MNKMIYNLIAIALVAAGVLMAMYGDTATGGFLLANAVAVPSLEVLAAEFKTATDRVNSKASEMSEMYVELKAKLGERTGVSQELKEAVDGALIQIKGMRDDVTELEQKMTQRQTVEPEGEKSWGEQIVAGEGYKSFGERGGSSSRTSFRSELKQVTQAAILD